MTLGPLTNLAVALEREASLPSLLKRLVMMGGAYKAPGNTTPTSEWNVHVDPDAAQAVFAAWRPDLDGPCDRTAARDGPRRHGARDPAAGPPGRARAARRRIAGGRERDGVGADAPRGSVAANPVLRFIGDALRFYFEFHERYDGFYGAFIHDPFAVAAALDRSLVFTQPVFVDVETGPGLAHAMTVADWRGITRNPPNLDVAVAGNAETFIERFIDRVGGLAATHARVAR